MNSSKAMAMMDKAIAMKAGNGPELVALLERAEAAAERCVWLYVRIERLEASGESCADLRKIADEFAGQAANIVGMP